MKSVPSNVYETRCAERTKWSGQLMEWHHHLTIIHMHLGAIGIKYSGYPHIHIFLLKQWLVTSLNTHTCTWICCRFYLLSICISHCLWNTFTLIIASSRAYRIYVAPILLYLRVNLYVQIWRIRKNILYMYAYTRIKSKLTPNHTTYAYARICTLLYIKNCLFTTQSMHAKKKSWDFMQSQWKGLIYKPSVCIQMWSICICEVGCTGVDMPTNNINRWLGHATTT